MASSSSPSDVTIYIGPPRGGYGDTASSLMMVERLGAVFKRTGIALQVAFHPAAEGQIRALWPDFDPSREQQVVRDYVFIREQMAKPAEVAIAFSANSEPSKKLAPVTVLYYEYEQLHPEAGGSGFLVPKRDRVLNSVFATTMDDRQTFVINTGFGNGIYAADRFRVGDSNKSRAFQALRAFAPGLRVSGETKLAYAYASSGELVQQYANALEKFVQNHGQDVVLVTNHKIQIRSPRIAVIDMNGMPFDLNQKIIKSSDVPILVTGDSSLSLAVEGGKTAFYSMYAWKRSTPRSLLASITAASPSFNRNSDNFETLSSILRMDSSGTRNYEDLFLKVFEDPQFQRELSDALRTIVKNDSLIKLVQRDIEFAKSLRLGFKPSFDTSVRLLWLLARDLKSVEQAISKTEQLIFDANGEDGLVRARRLFGLALLRQYSSSRFADTLSRALTVGDGELRSALAEAIHDAVGIGQIFTKLSPAAQREVRYILENIAGQSREQWGEHATRASFMLNRLPPQAADAGANLCKSLFRQVD